jgi:TatD DNase family protein
MDNQAYIDAHNHLQEKRLGLFLDQVIPVCENLGAIRMVVNAFSENDWATIKELSDRHSFVTPSYGLHPWYLGEKQTGWQDRLAQRLIANPKAHVGEVGLDLWMSDPDLPSQIETLRHSLQIAERYQRAITIHCLRAWELLLEILASERLPSRGFLLHAYSGPIELVAPLYRARCLFFFLRLLSEPRQRAPVETFQTNEFRPVISRDGCPFHAFARNSPRIRVAPGCKRRTDQSSGKYPISLLGIGRS